MFFFGVYVFAEVFTNHVSQEKETLQRYTIRKYNYFCSEKSKRSETN